MNIISYKTIPFVLFSLNFFQGLILSAILGIKKFYKALRSKKRIKTLWSLFILNVILFSCDWLFIGKKIKTLNLRLFDRLKPYVAMVTEEFSFDPIINYRLRLPIFLIILIMIFSVKFIKDKRLKNKLYGVVLISLLVFVLVNIYFIANNLDELNMIKDSIDFLDIAENKFPNIQEKIKDFIS